MFGQIEILLRLTAMYDKIPARGIRRTVRPFATANGRRVCQVSRTGTWPTCLTKIVQKHMIKSKRHIQ